MRTVSQPGSSYWWDDPDIADWQHGLCDTYAKAMQELHPHLRLGTLRTDGLVDHWFMHDDEYAYDSLGRHRLPYTGFGPENEFFFEQSLDEDPHDYGWHWPNFEGENAGPGDYERAKALIPSQHPWLTTERREAC